MSDTSDSEYEDALSFIISLEDPGDVYFLALVSAPPVLDSTFAHLDTIDIIYFSRTCHAAYTAVKKYLKRAFNFENHFRSFFRDPRGFRHLLARTGAAVSGSNALQFVTRRFWPESDLDLYVYANEAKHVCWWLTATGEGYKFVPSRGQPASWLATLDAQGEDDPNLYSFMLSDLRRILNFVKKPAEDSNELERHVQIMICGTQETPVSIAHAVLRFHSSCVMNIITHHAAYCLYPALTIRDQSLIKFDLGAWDQRRSEAIRRYQIRGWHVVPWDRLTPPYCQNSSFLQNDRYIGDKYCWTIPHTPLDDIPTVDYMTMNGWRVNVRHKGPKMRVNKLRMRGLKHPYTVAHLRPELLDRKSIVVVIKKILVRDIEAGRTAVYQGDELDREVYNTWQKVKDSEFADYYLGGENV